MVRLDTLKVRISNDCIRRVDSEQFIKIEWTTPNGRVSTIYELTSGSLGLVAGHVRISD